MDLFRLRHGFTGFLSFHVEQPCKQVVPLIIENILRRSFFPSVFNSSCHYIRYLLPAFSFRGVLSRTIPSVSHVVSRFLVLARFIRRHFIRLWGFSVDVLAFYSVVVVYRAFIFGPFCLVSCMYSFIVLVLSFSSDNIRCCVLLPCTFLRPHCTDAVATATE